MVKATLTWRMLLRRGWLVALACLAGIGAGWALSRVSVSATSAFHVSVRGANQTPYQASRLALSYAQLLPQAPGLRALVARETGRSPGAVGAHLTMSAQPATAIVFARYSAPSTAAALAGMSAVTHALRRASDGAGSQLRATVAPLTDPTTTSGFSRSRALALGAAGGLLIALALALALERRWPRVDDLRDLAELVPAPVSQVDERALPAIVGRLASGVPGGAARALVIRRGASAASVEQAWHEIAAAGAPPTAVLLVHRTPLRRRLLGARRHGVRTA
jgi:hypothetical protein